MERVRELVHADAAHKKGYIGSGITVAVMDTGIVGHPDFGHRIVRFLDFTGKKRGMYDDNGHGTHVSGTSAARLYQSWKIYGDGAWLQSYYAQGAGSIGNGNTAQGLAALKWS